MAIFFEASSFVCAVKPDEVLTECAFCEKKRKVRWLRAQSICAPSSTVHSLRTVEL